MLSILAFMHTPIMLILYHRKLTQCLLCIFLMLPVFFCCAEDTAPQGVLQVTYTSTKGAYYAARESYFIELLTLALEKSGEPYEMQPIEMIHHTQGRSVAFLQSGAYSIYWLNTNTQLEQELLPIRIPLYKGLIGWRLLLIRETQKEMFNHIDTLTDLQKLIALQGNDWPDTLTLKNNNFSVKTSAGYYNLFRMLNSRRGDFFPRGITEIWGELESYPELNLAVDTHIALRYPAAYYLFVNKNNPRLKNAVEKGLNIAVADGSFNKIFIKYFGAIIKKAELEKRKIFFLANPSMPAETPLDRKELWFSVDDFNKKTLGMER